MLGDQADQLGDEPDVVAEGEVGVETELHGAQVDLLHPVRLRLERGLVLHAGEGAVPPERERRAQPLRGPVRVARAEGRVTVVDEVGEAVRVDLRGWARRR
nr:hypothetical protein GCM10020093_004180 [Planobispora longispora]